MDTVERIEMTETRVAYRDIDMQGQMHNAAYLTLAEQALVHFWRYRPPLEDEPAFTMRRMECVFRKPLRYDDLARLTVRIDKIGMSTIGFNVLIEAAEEECAAVEIVWSAYDRKSGTEAAMPEAIRDWLYEFLP